jgi:hypothetical protein
VASDVSVPSTPASSSPEQLEKPTDRATLRITAGPVEIAVSGQGAATKALALGVIGPALTIGVGHLVGFPVWSVIVICALQVIVATLQRRKQ